MEPIRTTKYDFIELSAYQGVYSLIASREGQDGNVYQQWGKMRIGKNKYADKDWPVKVTLGDQKTAVAVLKQIINQIELGGEDVPF